MHRGLLVLAGGGSRATSAGMELAEDEMQTTDQHPLADIMGEEVFYLRVRGATGGSLQRHECHGSRLLSAAQVVRRFRTQAQLG